LDQYLKKLSQYFSKIKLSSHLILIIASLVVLLLWQNFNNIFLPVTLDITERIDLTPNVIKIYEDLNNDGFSESIIFGEIPEKKMSLLVVRNYSDVIQDQFNLDGKIIENGILFCDLNSDNYKEILAIYVNRDSLYYDVININSKSYLTKKQLLIAKPDSAVGNNWDVMLSEGSDVIDINGDGKPELVFGLKTGYAVYPRAIYSFDFVEKRLLNKFEISASPEKIIIDDFNNDGLKEIFFNTVITGNVKTVKKYNDQSAWIFLLNNNLDYIVPPRSFGKYPAIVITTNYFKNNFIIIEKDIQERKNTIYLFDNLLNPITSNSINYKTITGLTVIPEEKESFIYISTMDGEVVKLNENLEINKTSLLDFEELIFIRPMDYDKNEDTGLLIVSNKELKLLNKNLDLIGESKLDPSTNLPYPIITERKNGVEGIAQLGFGSKKSNFLLTLNKNKNFYFLYPLLILTFFAVVSLLYLIKKMILQFYYYFKSFLYLFYKTETGYCLVDSDLKIKYLNQNFLYYLKLQNSETKNLSELLIDHKNLLDSISKVREIGTEVKEKLFLNTNDLQFNGVVNAVPIKIFKNKVIAILVELKNYTQPIYEDRLMIWGKSIQKIAHDIKTPLSTIALNLKSIQINLENSGITNTEISQDIDVAKNEIERIKNLTKDFLKFVDLEKPSFQAISVEEIIIQSLKRFDSLRNNELKIDYISSDHEISIWADPRQIELVIHILVENSIDAMKGKGLILIENDLVQNLAVISGDMVQVSITDNGSGIKKDLLNRIFEPHFSTKNDGTGMGLAFAKKIIEDHKGEIDLHSREGFGTTFKFTLPIFRNSSL
jgi:signal transduction histidine kinase